MNVNYSKRVVVELDNCPNTVTVSRDYLDFNCGDESTMQLKFLRGADLVEFVKLILAGLRNQDTSNSRSYGYGYKSDLNDVDWELQVLARTQL